MITIELNEATVRLPQLVDDVTGGETVEITRQGRAVARLVSPPREPEVDFDAALAAIRAVRRREKITLDGISVRELIEEGQMSY
ncbi:MAG: type II toxin-antitoxin system Phd/YefM family antitoxin [Thermomicrobiales bacterium]